jgi:hypothetical protein
MESIPTVNPQVSQLGVVDFQEFIGLRIALRVVQFEFVPMFAGGPSSAIGRRSPIKTAVGGNAQ